MKAAVFHEPGVMVVQDVPTPAIANDELLIYFIISRRGQKLANILRDDRVSLSIGRDFHDPSSIRALSIAGHVSEVIDEKQRKKAVDMVLERHPGLRKLEKPEPSHSAVMLLFPSTVTILDYSKGLGHADVLTEIRDSRAFENSTRDKVAEALDTFGKQYA